MLIGGMVCKRERKYAEGNILFSTSITVEETMTDVVIFYIRCTYVQRTLKLIKHALHFQYLTKLVVKFLNFVVKIVV